MPNILQEFKAIHQRLDRMDQEISKCRLLDGVSAKTKFEQLLARVEETHKQINEWQAKETQAEVREHTEQFVRDNVQVLLGKLQDLEDRHNRLMSSVIRLWTRSEKFLSVLVPAAKAEKLFSVNGWKTRRAANVLCQLVQRIARVESRGLWRRLWRLIRGRRSTSKTNLGW
jgi:alanyl-tRNA synthetase